jgi:hypothetical protein
MTDLEHGLAGETVLSHCSRYRYCLWRDVPGGGNGVVVFVGLNPSTADAQIDDPTIRRCRGFASRWGYRKLCVLNLFAFRATKPAGLFEAADPIGTHNDDFLTGLSRKADLVVACWGNHGAYMERDKFVCGTIGKAKCLGTTRRGQPKHPLYVPYESQLIPF